MATYRIGHWADIHHPNNGLSNSTVRGDLDRLVNGLSSDMVVHGGDQVIGQGQVVPHTPESIVRDYWENIVGGVSGATDISYQVPGNHDIPVDHNERISKEYIGSRAETPQEVQPVSGLTVLLMDTQGPARVQGGKDAVGQDYAYIPLRDMIWLTERVKEAHSRGDIIIIVGHTPIWFDSSVMSTQPEDTWSSLDNSYLEDLNAYEVVQNYQYVINRLTAESPVVYLSGHVFQTSAETYRDVNGVYHTYQDHYSDGPTTFAYCDVDTLTGNVVYKTVESGTFSENTVMDVTPSW